MRELIWQTVAWVVTQDKITDWLIKRAQKTPYSNITSPDGQEVYMRRWWLFNPYPGAGSYKRAGWRDWLPSIRVHHIMREDRDRHLHDHPWNARTIILRGWYDEERPFDSGNFHRVATAYRARGYTGRLLYGQYHRISAVAGGGTFTMFITWRYQGTWGFAVDGRKVPWREYLGL